MNTIDDLVRLQENNLDIPGFNIKYQEGNFHIESEIQIIIKEYPELFIEEDIARPVILIFTEGHENLSDAIGQFISIYDEIIDHAN